MEPMGKDPSTGELIARLTRQLISLVRQEIEVAKVEMAVKARRAARHSLLLAAGGGLVFAGLLLFLFAAFLRLSQDFSPLVAAIIVGVGAMNAGLVLIAVGYWLLNRDRFVPERTLSLLERERYEVEDRIA